MERRICGVLGQHRSTQRKVPRRADNKQALTEDIIALARQYGRYGYRRVTALPRSAGWYVNRKRVERFWRREGLKVPQKQPKRSRLWLNNGSCIRLRPDILVMSGLTTSSRTAPMMAASSESLRSSMKRAGNVWRRWLRAESGALTFWRSWLICSSSSARQRTYGLTMAPSLSLPPSRTDWYRSASRPLHHIGQPVGEWLL